MTKPSLNQRTATTLPPPETGQRTYFDAKLPGFGLRVSSSGHRSWVAVYRHHGRKRRFTLGPVETLAADDARTQAFEVLARARRGEDPAAEKQAERRAETFGELAALYLQKHAAKKRDGGKRDREILERDVLPAWRLLKADTIRRRDVRRILEKIVERGAPVAANRALALVRKVFNFGLGREIVTANPCTGVERPGGKEQQRDKVLAADEIRSVWAALDSEPVVVAGLFRLAFLTAQRTGELKTMRRENLDLESGWWTIPAERAKNGKAHRVPLSPMALNVLRELEVQANGSPWAFPSDDAASGYLATLQKPTRRVRKAAKVAFNPHDVRRTVASHMTGMGISRLTVKRILNHMDKDVTAIYDRHSYDPEKRQALDAWARRLHAIVTGETAPKVVELRRS